MGFGGTADALKPLYSWQKFRYLQGRLAEDRREPPRSRNAAETFHEREHETFHAYTSAELCHWNCITIVSQNRA